LERVENAGGGTCRAEAPANRGQPQREEDGAEHANNGPSPSARKIRKETVGETCTERTAKPEVARSKRGGNRDGRPKVLKSGRNPRRAGEKRAKNRVTEDLKKVLAKSVHKGPPQGKNREVRRRNAILSIPPSRSKVKQLAHAVGAPQVLKRKAYQHLRK